jgi:hypothetical protein
MRDKLVQDLMDMHKTPPETEEGFRAGQKLLARYAKNNSKKQPARTKRGMTSILTDPAIAAHLQVVKDYIPMCATTYQLDASLGYGTTATFPTLPSGVWDGSKFLLLGVASYQPVVDQLKHELLLTGMYGGSSVDITLKKTLQSGTQDPTRQKNPI